MLLYQREQYQVVNFYAAFLDSVDFVDIEHFSINGSGHPKRSQLSGGKINAKAPSGQTIQVIVPQGKNPGNENCSLLLS